MNDLIVLVADKNMQHALKGALNRPKALGIREISFDCIVHTNRDPGVRKTGADLLRLKRSQFPRALMVLDFEGSGTDRADARELEAELDERLQTDWGDNAKAIAIEPELDVWMWGSDNKIQQVLNWSRDMGAREWVQQQGYDLDADGKPVQPKEALEALLREIRQPRSSALYLEIASQISLRNCTDDAFQRLKLQLANWFSSDNRY